MISLNHVSFEQVVLLVASLFIAIVAFQLFRLESCFATKYRHILKLFGKELISSVILCLAATAIWILCLAFAKPLVISSLGVGLVVVYSNAAFILMPKQGYKT